MVTALKPVIDLQPVASSNLAAIGYDLASQTAAVKFKHSDTIHHYGEFSAEKWASWQAADSKGMFFAAEVRNQHPHTIVPTED